ncbi:hypothetical protein SAMN03159422_05238 [Agrobacterium fabrum]|uniref:Uncharacterized protein n=2 Tax=Agrobacterium fabrum TaxID=1176649 RepID=A0A7Z7FSA9_9HYPH|nr:hypothetical protein SAMN03159422_05238 [Agrobacterium fabrum]SDK41659.1 hypothetical protein SAMN05428983_4911 [Agrobacterium fabrum]SES23666.1 hypothetical protein SAMN03159504_05233 [Agrobacterium fabrum]
MIMIGLSVLPFWNGISVMLIDSVALTFGLLGGLFRAFDIMPATLGVEEIAWRNKHPEEYEEEAWEAVPCGHLENIAFWAGVRSRITLFAK